MVQEGCEESAEEDGEGRLTIRRAAQHRQLPKMIAQGVDSTLRTAVTVIYRGFMWPKLCSPPKKLPIRTFLLLQRSSPIEHHELVAIDASEVIFTWSPWPPLLCEPLRIG